MKKVLQVSNYYSPDIGGIEKVAKAISDALDGRMEVRVVCFAKSGESRVEMVDGIKVCRIREVMKVASQQLSIEAVGEIRHQLTQYDPDYVILHMPNPFLAAIVLRYMKEDVKFIAFWHSDIVKQKIGEVLFRRQTYRLIRRAARIVATSPDYVAGSRYLSLVKEKCRVIPLCIEEKVLYPTDREKKKSERIRAEFGADKILLLAVGRHVPYKGFRYVIEAMDGLPEKYELVIAGPAGTATKELRSMAGQRKGIHFTGAVSEDTLHAYMMACDVFCFPSVTRNEAFGLALAEGMSYGKPAVTFTIPGSGVNYVSMKAVTGIEVPNADAAAFADAVRRLGEDEALRKKMGDAAARRVRELFVPERFRASFRKMMEELS